MTAFIQSIATQLNIKPTQVQAAVDLLDGGNTIPFIARYRKEATGTLDEEQLRLIQSDIERLHAPWQPAVKWYLPLSPNRVN